jgi:hypothetical protein
LGIATGIDKLLDIVQHEKRISIKDAAAQLNVSNDKIETWSRVLADENLLELVYPANPFESPFLKMIGFKEDKKKEEEKKEKEKEEEKKDKKKKPKEKKPAKKPKETKRPVTGFVSRFKNTPAYRTYKEKLEEQKSKPKTRKGRIFAVIIIIIIIIFVIIGVQQWLRNLIIL